jgi:hypothetical protein
VNGADAALHEARHCAMAIFVGRPVECVTRVSGMALAGETAGHTLVPVQDRVELSQIPICLAGYWGEPGWPPSFEEAQEEKLEALGLVLKLLGINQRQYDRLVAVTEEIIADPNWQALRDAVARALAFSPRLDSEDLARICAAYDVPVPRAEEPVPCAD